MTSTTTTLPGGTLSLADDLTLTRMGYGAMQLAGPGVFGSPADRDAARAVLRRVVELGITHIDTSDFYGPFVTNEIITEMRARSNASMALRAAGRSAAPAAVRDTIFVDLSNSAVPSSFSSARIPADTVD